MVMYAFVFFSLRADRARFHAIECPPSYDRIGHWLEQDPRCSYFLKLCRCVHIENLFYDHEEIETLFVPTNEAFEKRQEFMDSLISCDMQDSLTLESKKKLRRFLLYHIYRGKRVAFSDLLSYDGKQLIMFNKKPTTIEISCHSKKIVVQISSRCNSATIISDKPASNGIIYLIDDLLCPPDCLWR